MSSQSILFAGVAPSGVDDCPQPACFADLNLDQVITKLTVGKDEYHLAPLFHSPLGTVEQVQFRQSVFQDIERAEVRAVVTAFAEQTLVAKYTYRAHEMRTETRDFGHYHRARLFLNAVERYCGAVAELATGLSEVGVRSAGLGVLRDYLIDYVSSDTFTALRGETGELEEALDRVRYCVLVKGDRVTVGPYSDQADYSEQVTDTFERFQQGAAADYRDTPTESREEEFAELAILDLVAKLYPDLFAALDAFCREHIDYLDETVATADREFQFYLSYLDYVQPLRSSGLVLSYPRLSADTKHELALDTFDLALAAQLTEHGDAVVVNDIALRGPERILVVSGPNNGGKTTLARTFGQLHYLARLGCPVPGREVELFLCDRVYTHFERREDISTLAGKLQDELNRLHADLQQATPASVFVLNEVFNSTTAADALFLSRKILEQVGALDALTVCVTFLEELSTLNEKTVSMVSQVDPDDPAIRRSGPTRSSASLRTGGRTRGRSRRNTG